jgi:membrane protease YdiL (CAAX protease family)
VNDLQELWRTLAAFLILAGAGGLLCAALWLLVPGVRRRLLPLQRRREVPWTGLAICLCFGLLYLLPPLIYQLLAHSGLFAALYGQDDGLPALVERQALWAMSIAYPIVAVTIIGSFHCFLRARPALLGLTCVRAAQNFVAGYLGWLLFAPLALLVYWLTTLVMTPQPHPMQRAGQQALLPVEWGLIVFSAVVAAPLVEELLFRGVLLPWQTARSLDAQLVVAVAALAVSLLFARGKEGDLNPWPALFVTAMLPGMPLLPILYYRFHGRAADPLPEEPIDASQQVKEGPPPLGHIRTPAVGEKRSPLETFASLAADKRVHAQLAVYSNALLFAAFHSSVWPSPIPLFPLGIGLAWLAYRTQSLIGPLVLHALFNAVACLVLVLTQ